MQKTMRGCAVLARARGSEHLAIHWPDSSAQRTAARRAQL